MLMVFCIASYVVPLLLCWIGLYLDDRRTQKTTPKLARAYWMMVVVSLSLIPIFNALLAAIFIDNLKIGVK